MAAVADLVRYSQIATPIEVDAIRQFVESSHTALEISNSVGSGRRVLEVMMGVAVQAPSGSFLTFRERAEGINDGI
jgi:hypothetical protein